MPRLSKGPRLYLDRSRGQWQIRDGSYYLRTDCAQSDIERAQKLLAEYIGNKYAPPKSGNPPLADILLLYARERLPAMKSRSAKYNIGNLAKFWGDKYVADVNARNCRLYAANRTAAAARSDLEKLGAAIKWWHREHGPLDRVPEVTKPPRNPPRERWLTRSEMARLLWAARRTEHLKRLILVAFYTGSRLGVLRRLEWSWIDLNSGIMRRRGPGELETANKRTPPIRLPRKLVPFLRRWRRDGVRYVIHYNGQPISRDPHTAWRRACGVAGLKKIGIHVLRHTRATHMAQAGVAPWKAAGFLGMTVRIFEANYAHHHPDWQEDVADI